MGNHFKQGSHEKGNESIKTTDILKSLQRRLVLKESRSSQVSNASFYSPKTHSTIHTP